MKHERNEDKNDFLLLDIFSDFFSVEDDAGVEISKCYDQDKVKNWIDKVSKAKLVK